jgi:SPP1 gp7 family putative phage head morphogenesis protein
MATANQDFTDALVRHQIYLQRYSGQLRNDIIEILNASEEDIAMRIRDKLQTSDGIPTSQDWKRLQTLKALLEAIRTDAWDEAKTLLQDQMIELSYQEPTLLDRNLKTILPVLVDTVMPSENLLRGIATSRPFEGLVLKDWADKMAAEDIRRIGGAVQAGMVAGDDAATIARRVVGTGSFKGADGVTEITRRQVQSVVRTAVQHVANESREAWLDENSDIFNEEQFVATLDSRTTPVCRANDGQRFPIGDGPRPPLHFCCRSLRIAVIDGALAGNRPAKPLTEKMLVKEYASQKGLEGVKTRDNLPYGTKGAYDKWARGRIREMVGPVPATETYQTWLAKQGNAFQEDVLGKTKAKLFRNGELTLDKFVDQNGSGLTLEQLAKKHADAFRAAGLDPDQ